MVSLMSTPTALGSDAGTWSPLVMLRYRSDCRAALDEGQLIVNTCRTIYKSSNDTAGTSSDSNLGSDMNQRCQET